MYVRNVKFNAEDIHVDEEAARESKEDYEQESDPIKKAAKQKMLVPQNGKEVLAQMI